MTSAADSLKGGNVTRDSVKKAAEDAKSATDKLTSDLKKLGKPNTSSGAQAQQKVDQLSSQVSEGVDSIQTTVENVSSVSSAIDAVTTVSSTLRTLKIDITAAYNTLSKLDPGSELQQGSSRRPTAPRFTVRNSQQLRRRGGSASEVLRHVRWSLRPATRARPARRRPPTPRRKRGGATRGRPATGTRYRSKDASFHPQWAANQ
jgi:hypothetical protein